MSQSEFRAECSKCQKVYDKPKTYQNHLRSQGHKLASLERGEQNKENQPSNEDIEETEDEEFLVLNETFCLFYLYESPDLAWTMTHMRKTHGLFIPQSEYISDLPALLKYLHVTIAEFHQCLYCESTKRSAEAARAHMISKGHCTVNAEDVQGFYEYSDDEDAEEGENGKLKAKEAEILIPEDDKLTLPSGKQLGHRSKSHLYRQHLPPPEVRAQRKAIADSAAEPSSPSNNRNTQLTTRARGEMGLVGLSDPQRRSLRDVEMKLVKAGMRVKNEHQAAVEKRLNLPRPFKG